MAIRKMNFNQLVNQNKNELLHDKNLLLKIEQKIEKNILKMSVNKKE